VVLDSWRVCRESWVYVQDDGYQSLADSGIAMVSELGGGWLGDYRSMKDYVRKIG
jgi:hypothetical protein